MLEKNIRSPSWFGYTKNDDINRDLNRLFRQLEVLAKFLLF